MCVCEAAAPLEWPSLLPAPPPPEPARGATVARRDYSRPVALRDVGGFVGGPAPNDDNWIMNEKFAPQQQWQQ